MSWADMEMMCLVGLQEYFGDYSNIGHNSLSNLILLWIIPK